MASWLARPGWQTARSWTWPSWCGRTGYRPDFDWIEVPIFDDAGDPTHHRGVVDAAPGLYFLGLPFQHTPTSDHIGGVGTDARHIAEHLAALPGRSRRRVGQAASRPSTRR
jgi:putative flavoprotein involved in K+ transport